MWPLGCNRHFYHWRLWAAKGECVWDGNASIPLAERDRAGAILTAKIGEAQLSH